MRKSRFTEEQIPKVLKENAAGLSAGELCRKYGVSDATFVQTADQRSFATLISAACRETLSGLRSISVSEWRVPRRLPTCHRVY